MYHQLSETKKYSFCQLLNVVGDYEEQLARIKSEWVFWLRTHYTTTTIINPTDVPFYTEKFHTLCEKVTNREELNGFNPSKPFFKPFTGDITSNKLFIPIPENYKLFSWIIGSTSNLPKSVTRELSRLPEGVIIGIYYEEDYKILSHLSLEEYRTKGSLKKIGIQLESLRKFSNRCNYIGYCESFVISSTKGLEMFSKGLICDIFGSYFDLRYWRKD